MKCPKCRRIEKVYKNGKRPFFKHGVKKVRQSYICMSCGYQWCE